jgi:predicted phage baseplate assembly protein
VVFLPFGEQGGSRDVLALDIVCPVDGGLFPSRRGEADNAMLVIGVQADVTNGDLNALQDGATLEVTLRDATARYPVPVVEDTTAGFMRSGVLVLDVSAVSASPQAFSLELRAPGGFARPPRITRLGLNAVPVRQGALVERELHIASSLPDQELRLQQAGLEFGRGAEPVKVEVEEGGVMRVWKRRELLDDSAPDDDVYMLDTTRATVTFGNGVNGRMPPNGAQVLLTYTTSDGAEGNAARNQRWVVTGIDGTYGSNPDPMSGGAGGFDRADQRREARRRAREEHALVTAADLEGAALALPALEVARAWAMTPAAPTSGPGIVSLVVMRARAGDVEPDVQPETPRWLAAIEQRLSQRLPLGQRLQVRAPAYVPFRVDLHIEAVRGYSEASVEAAVRGTLRERMALVASRPGGTQRAMGLGVTQRDLAAWVRKVDGVLRILSLRLFDGQGKPIEAVVVTRLGLPKIALGASTVRVQRPAPGRAT